MMRALLVHGMGRTPLSLAWLAADLRRAGLQPTLVGYAAWAESFDGMVRRVRAHVARWEREAVPYACIGHSLGGLLLRAALGAESARWARHLVLLGTPNHPPRLALRLAHQMWYRAVNGASGQHLANANFFERLPPVAVPCTVIAGTRENLLTRRFFREAPNDGIVAVDETQLPAPARQLTFPVGHTFMMNDARVRAAIREAVREV